MSLPDEYYTVEEIAENAGFTVRTVRYYTVCGLIPPPVSRGRHALYNRNHLRRLELVGRLKRALLPMKHIIAVMETLDNAQVETFLESEDAGASLLPDTPDLAVARSVLFGRFRAIRQSSSASGNKENDGLPDGTSWRRIALRSGFVLNVRLPLTPVNRGLLARIQATAEESSATENETTEQ